MRPFFLLFTLLLTASLVLAQDDAAALANQAAQQAMQQAQQAAQQAMEASQRASEDAMRTSQIASTNAMSQAACCLGALPPGFSVKPGRYSGPVTLRLTDATRGVYIYYTTDGWTPTTFSTRYRGPIVIDSTTTLNAIAISPDGCRSIQVSAQYVINGKPAAQPKPAETAPTIGEVPMRDGKPVLPQP